jgi:hypothetical protein
MESQEYNLFGDKSKATPEVVKRVKDLIGLLLVTTEANGYNIHELLSACATLMMNSGMEASRQFKIEKIKDLEAIVAAIRATL